MPAFHINRAETRILVGFILAVLILLSITGISFVTTASLNNTLSLVAHTQEVRAAIEDAFTAVQDAETGQRGYLITGEESYLAPYDAAVSIIGSKLDNLANLTSDNPAQQNRVAELRAAYAAKLQELQQTIALRRSSGFEAARQVVLNGSGKQEMDRIRAIANDMEMAEQDLLVQREAEAATSSRYAFASVGVFTLLDFVLLGFIFVLIRRDRAAQQRAEAARLRATLASIGDAVVATDTAGRVTFVNGVAERLMGWTQAEAAGRSLPDIFNIVNETTRKQVENPIDRVLKEGVVVGLANHTVLLARDGVERPIDDSGAPIRDDEGRVIGGVLVFRDISARRQEERAAQLLDETSRALASSLDPQTTLKEVAALLTRNMADLCLISLLEAEDTLRPLAVAVANPAQDEAAAGLVQQLAAPEAAAGMRRIVAARQPLIFEPLPQDPALAPFQPFNLARLLLIPLAMPDRVLGLLALGVGSSARYRNLLNTSLGEELAHRIALAVDNAALYQDARAAVQLRDQFMTIAAHELRTPLTTLLGTIQLIQRRSGREGSLSERDQRSLQITIEQARRLNAMIMTLLDISRIEGGQLSIERAPFDLVALAQRVTQETAPTLHQHSLQVEALPEPILVFGDELRLEQVIRNLVQNAIKYSPAGGPVEIRVWSDAGNAHIAIRDQGLGIPEAARARLFQRFYRAPNVGSIAGLGVGLYVVREIVGLHGGHIDVESSEGAGSTFTITLPLADGTTPQSPSS